MASYIHVNGFLALKTLRRNLFLKLKMNADEVPHGYLIKPAASLLKQIETHAGITLYLLLRNMITPAIEQRIAIYQEKLAKSYNFSFVPAHWLVFTISCQKVSIANSILPENTDEKNQTLYQPNLRNLCIDDEHSIGVRALILGYLSMLHEIVEKRHQTK